MSSVTEQMQREWNARAVEDANFYVAFGRRDQSPEEFFDTSKEVVRGIEWEMKRGLPAPGVRGWRALEIGCGPGRLMRPLSRHFGEIHGVDVSDEMIRRAAVNLRDIPHAHPHHTSGADLAQFAADSFDLVYSYAVFQHIPSRDVVFSYLREAVRVLRPGGLLRAQLNGLPTTAEACDTWSGVRIAPEEIHAFAREHGIQLLALEGVFTQYMWTTWRKGPVPNRVPLREARIRRITNAHSSEPAAPRRGRFASIAIWIENLPASADLNRLEVRIAGATGRATYIGPNEPDGLQQVNVVLPKIEEGGLQPVEMLLEGHALCPPRPFRILTRAPQVPRVTSVNDGVNILSGRRIASRSIKVTFEETKNISDLIVLLNGAPVPDLDIFVADPMPPRHEVNIAVPAAIPPGPATIEFQLGRRRLAPVQVEIVS